MQAGKRVCANPPPSDPVQQYTCAGKREVFFEANGIPRVVEVADHAEEVVVGKKAARERADLAQLGSVGAPMAGTVVEVQVKPGELGRSYRGEGGGEGTAGGGVT